MQCFSNISANKHGCWNTDHPTKLQNCGFPEDLWSIIITSCPNCVHLIIRWCQRASSLKVCLIGDKGRFPNLGHEKCLR